jgi:hypothetical protein
MGTDKSNLPPLVIVSLDDSNDLQAGWNQRESNQKSANDLCCNQLQFQYISFNILIMGEIDFPIST